ncbi:Hypothetical predicted protein [Paramuricea clavata]|uniref:Uncharacterized protein n=1 Tax=Paramuricea clavata TaxID=317549 RepID=A0A6S7KEG7_PARCT|nr:Hypothetical predicted protein [Paramuricea clavata]
METNGGGWTVFQRRQDASVDFYRLWQEYKDGFGDLNGNFWIGLEKIHRLTKSGQNILRVDLTDFANDTAYAQYENFVVDSESEFYKLKVDTFSGNAGDSLIYHNGMKFSTKDQDNDHASVNCAVACKGSWWYNSCKYSNLNGQYFTTGEGETSNPGILWHYWKSDGRYMKKTEMKTRSKQF